MGKNNKLNSLARSNHTVQLKESWLLEKFILWTLWVSFLISNTLLAPSIYYNPHTHFYGGSGHIYVSVTCFNYVFQETHLVSRISLHIIILVQRMHVTFDHWQ